MKLFRSFNDWMFGYGSPVTMGLFRAIFGTLAFTNLAMVALDFNSWFTETGFVRTAELDRWNHGTWRFDLLAHVTNSNVTIVFYALTMLAALMTALGLFTRVSSIALLLGVTSLHHRCPDILHSGDTLMRVMLLYIAVAPSGAALSLDRWLAVRSGKAPAEPPDVSLWPQRMMQIQVAVMYVTTVWHKSFGAWWLNGTATWYPPQLDEFDRFSLPGFVDQQPMIAITTYGTLLVELALGTLVFAKPMRKWVLLGGVLLHLGIEYRMNIPLFAFLSIGTYVTFYDGREVAEWLKRVVKRFKPLNAVAQRLAPVSSEVVTDP